MDIHNLRERMSRFDLFDNVLIRHSYTKYMRDYELVVGIHIGPADPGVYSYLFKYCVEAKVRTSLTDETYKNSLDERLIEYESGKDLVGHIWGVQWSQLYPGWTPIEDSELAADWTRRIGIPFYEVVVHSNVFIIGLIFSGLEVQRLSDHVDPNIDKWAYLRFE